MSKKQKKGGNLGKNEGFLVGGEDLSMNRMGGRPPRKDIGKRQ